ncbi:hypothetical protein O9993_23285 [Vibrio lentus]|nr:hypothetical protein [Vibrio lentus]
MLLQRQRMNCYPSLKQQRLTTDLNIVNSKLASLVSGFDYQVNELQLNTSATQHNSQSK